MSSFHVGIHQILGVLRILGSLTSTWPPSSKATKLELALRDFVWAISTLNVVALLIPLVLAAYYYSNNILRVMKALSELTALTEVFLNLILCRIGRSRLQKLIMNLEDFLKSTKKYERIVLQKYIDRYLFFFGFVGTSFIAAAVAFSCGPLVLSTEFPAESWYPFSTESPRIRWMLYLQQVFAILQTGFCITVDFTIGMLFWYPAARLEMLGLEIQNADDEKEMKICAQKHQEIIRFVEDAQKAVGYLILKTNVTMAIAIICGAFPLIHHEPFAVVSQFICMVIAGCQRLYITAWPADDLKDMSERFALSAYSAPWTNKSLRSMNNVLIIMQRSQRALLISMGGMLPALSLEYYASFLYTTLSFFMTMRAVIGD